MKVKTIGVKAGKIGDLKAGDVIAHARNAYIITDRWNGDRRHLVSLSDGSVHEFESSGIYDSYTDSEVVVK